VTSALASKYLFRSARADVAPRGADPNGPDRDNTSLYDGAFQLIVAEWKKITDESRHACVLHQGAEIDSLPLGQLEVHTNKKSNSRCAHYLLNQFSPPDGLLYADWSARDRWLRHCPAPKRQTARLALYVLYRNETRHTYNNIDSRPRLQIMSGRYYILL
jgi:hypothetical protein